jgi:biopolymer transport protein ExbD
MKNKRTAPEVNAGSMADIAFLLLIFFLVTTTIASDKGFKRKLPKLCPPGTVCSAEINERNILRITLNSKQEIMMNNDLVAIDEIKEKVKLFVDNNGDNSCDYCNGLGISSSSDNPTKAVISLKSDPQSMYNLFIKVQDELTKAYFDLRASYAKNVLGKDIEALTKEELKQIKDAYPFIVSEAETN